MSIEYVRYVLEADGVTPRGVSLDENAITPYEMGKDRFVVRHQYAEGDLSTVFLTADHNYTGSGPPVLWETMAFGKDGNEVDGYTARYSSHADAVAGHYETLAALLFQAPKPLRYARGNDGLVHVFQNANKSRRGVDEGMKAITGCGKELEACQSDESAAVSCIECATLAQ